METASITEIDALPQATGCTAHWPDRIWSLVILHTERYITEAGMSTECKELPTSKMGAGSYNTV